ncbi:hypothetical protein DFJ43DRAFT_173482 [Lentinula guzmanii]|uniref:Uncharacterized protein n=1 Tax=Lentinula guzmanii TaxID=2804957 RepID=A0AA38JP46_9AGAR|nr:hypothetical protein DFJ43DRAFT_173482 [Lentinula guzmanii]
MKLVNFGLLVLPLALSIAGAPLPMTRDSEVVPADEDVADCHSLNNHPQYGIFYTGPGCPSSRPCQLTSAHWDNDLNPFNVWDSVTMDHNSDGESMGYDSVPSTELAIRLGSDLVLVSRDATKLQKTGKTLTKTGSALGKAAKGVDAVPEIGEIVGTAIQVVATFLKLLGHIFSGIAEAERKSAHARGEFTQKVTDQTVKEHPGWLVVTVHPKHTIFFQGNEHTDWSHSTTSIKTVCHFLGSVRGHHLNFTTQVTGTYKFDVYAARAGIFSNDGDGGYQNWAWSAPSQHIKLAGYENRRLVFTGGTPQNHPTSGKCMVHAYQYQKNHKKVNELDHYTIVAVMKDAKGVIVGFEGNGDGSKPLPVSSQLHDSLTIITGPNDKAPLSFSFDKDKWDSNSKSRCTVGKFEHGVRQMDCNFQCKF